MKKDSLLICALLSTLTGAVFAAQPLTLSLDAASAGPGKFAGEEIRREAAARGMSVVRADAKAPADAIHIKLTVGTPAGTKAVAHVNRTYEVDVDGARRRSTSSPTSRGPPRAATPPAATAATAASPGAWPGRSPATSATTRAAGRRSRPIRTTSPGTRRRSQGRAPETSAQGHGAKGVACAGCHASTVGHDTSSTLSGTYPFRLADNGGTGPGNFTCANTASGCHDTPPASLVRNHTRAVMAAVGYTPQVNTWIFAPECVDCHDPHGDDANLSMVGQMAGPGVGPRPNQPADDVAEEALPPVMRPGFVMEQMPYPDAAGANQMRVVVAPGGVSPGILATPAQPAQAQPAPYTSLPGQSTTPGTSATPGAATGRTPTVTTSVPGVTPPGASSATAKPIKPPGEPYETH